MESNKFSSIKWKFVLVYFLLVFIAMVIVGIFIVGRLEKQQVNNISLNMEKHIETMTKTSTYLIEDDWTKHKLEIQDTLNDWRLDNKENLYVIAGEQRPKIIASSLKDSGKIIDRDALPFDKIEPTLIKKAFLGKKSTEIIEDKNESRRLFHLAYPVLTDVGRVKGIIYMTTDLRDVETTVKDSKIILTNATIIALIITMILGFLISDSIVEPIRDVTKKAEEMALGDFDQRVDVRSNDEIGQLASMFNHLTLKLNDTISEIDLERSKLNTIFSYMAEGVVAIDNKGYIIHANPNALEILNMEKLDSFAHKKVMFPYERVNLQDINQVEPGSDGDIISELDGEIYKVKYAHFKTEAGSLGGLILVFQNMTNEYRLDNMRKEFVANVSHELKTPITTIKSYTETLMLGGIEENIQLSFLNIINDECNRMARLVKDLLQLSNLDFKKTVWNKKSTNINKFVGSIVERLKLSFEEKGQKYSLKLGDNLPNIQIDRDAIEQVVLNIISNAMKYTEENGEVFIATYMSENFITIKVRDTGIGIPKEDLERIFERFYRVEKARSRDSGGTGLGLAIAREIINGHNGLINIASEYGKGTTVEIKLPI